MQTKLDGNTDVLNIDKQKSLKLWNDHPRANGRILINAELISSADRKYTNRL